MKHKLLYGGGVQKLGRGTPQALSLASIERFDTPILDETPTNESTHSLNIIGFTKLEGSAHTAHPKHALIEG